MKFRIYLTPNDYGIPFNYAHQLCGVFHSWLGANELHDMMSLYSLGWLSGKARLRPETPQEKRNGALYFGQGARWDIGIYDDDIAERLMRGLLLKPFDFYGMGIRKVEKLEPPAEAFSQGTHRFLANSPILLRRVEADYSRTHITFKDDAAESASILNRLIHKKADEAGFAPGRELRLQFDEDFRNPKTRLIDIKGIKNKASVCPIIAKGPAEALEFLWMVGAGELTGVGFGSLDHTAPKPRRTPRPENEHAQSGNTR